MSSSPTIVLNIQASGVGEAITAINQVQAATKKLGNEGSGGLMGSIAGGELLAHGLEKAAAFVKDFAKESLDMAVSMSEAIEKSQMGGKAFQEFAFAAKFSGASMDTITIAMKKLSENVVNGSAELKAYGVDMAALKGKTPEDQFRTLMERMEEIKDPAEKADFALKAFGKSGMDLIPMAAHFKELTGEAEELGVVMNDGALQCARDMVEDFKKLWMQMQVLFVNSLPAIREWGDKAVAVFQYFSDTENGMINNIIDDVEGLVKNFGIAFDWLRENWDKLLKHWPETLEDFALFAGRTLLDGFLNPIKVIAEAFEKLWHGIKTGSASEMTDAALSAILLPQDIIEKQIKSFKENSKQLFEDLAKDTGSSIPKFLDLKGLFAGQEENYKKFLDALDAAEAKHKAYDALGSKSNLAPGASAKDITDTSKLAGAAAYGSAEAYKTIAQYNAQTNGVENLQLIEQRKMNDKLDELKSEVAYNTQEGGSGLDAYQFA